MKKIILIFFIFLFGISSCYAENDYTARGVYYDDFMNLAYVAAATDGLNVYDCSTDPPLLINDNTLNFLGFDVHVNLDLSIAFVSSLNNGIFLVDITDPQNMDVLTSYSTIGTSYGIYSSIMLVFVADDNFFTIVDFSSIEAPVESNIAISGGGARNVFVDELIAYVTSENSGLYVYSFNDGGITLLSSFSKYNSINGFTLFGDFTKLFCVSNEIPYTFVLLDVSDPANVYEQSNFLAGFPLKGAYSSENTLYLFSLENHLISYDISDPFNPILKRNFTVDYPIFDMQISSSRIFIAAGSLGLKVINLKNNDNSIYKILFIVVGSIILSAFSIFSLIKFRQRRIIKQQKTKTRPLPKNTKNERYSIMTTSSLNTNATALTTASKLWKNKS